MVTESQNSNFNIGDYIFDSTCGEEGFIVGLSSDKKTATIQYLTGDGPEEDNSSCIVLELVDRPAKAFDIEEACGMCPYLQHANNCTIQPGEYCKRFHRFEGGLKQ